MVSPAFWGGLGACVFLLKTLSDKGRENQFDSRSLQGWRTRILLGAVLGSVIVYIYDPESFLEGSLQVDANAIAFFTGVGIKVMYGAIEKTIDELAQRFNLDSVRKVKSREGVIREYLEQELALLDPKENKHKRECVLSLIDGITRPPQNPSQGS